MDPREEALPGEQVGNGTTGKWARGNPRFTPRPFRQWRPPTPPFSLRNVPGAGVPSGFFAVTWNLTPWAGGGPPSLFPRPLEIPGPRSLDGGPSEASLVIYLFLPPPLEAEDPALPPGGGAAEGGFPSPPHSPLSRPPTPRDGWGPALPRPLPGGASPPLLHPSLSGSFPPPGPEKCGGGMDPQGERRPPLRRTSLPLPGHNWPVPGQNRLCLGPGGTTPTGHRRLPPDHQSTNERPPPL